MVLPPFYRLFNLFVKVFTKPILNVVRSTHMWNFRFNKNLKDDEINMADKFFIELGLKKYRFEIWMNYKLFKMRAYSMMSRRPLPKDLAWERGVDLLYDIVFYLMILAIGGYEVFHSYSNSQRLKRIQREDVSQIELGFQETEARINELRANKELLTDEISKKATQMHSDLDELIEALKQDLSQDDLGQLSNDVMYLIATKEKQENLLSKAASAQDSQVRSQKAKLRRSAPFLSILRLQKPTTSED